METTTENIPQCWQDFNDVIAAGVDRVILYGPPEPARHSPDSTQETCKVAHTVSFAPKT